LDDQSRYEKVIDAFDKARDMRDRVSQEIEEEDRLASDEDDEDEGE